MFVISYCQIYACHPTLDLDKRVIFRSFQQSADKIFDLSLFSSVSFNQLKDVAIAVLADEKSISLSELCSIDLKFTIYTLNKWFKSTIKSKFL